jgi:hypothetical protein
MNKPHKHAALIKAWADGAEIQYLNTYATAPHWVDVVENKPEWDDSTEYRIKPEKEYPKSTLDYNDLCKIVNKAIEEHRKGGSGEDIYTFMCRICADEAVKRYIKDNEE